MDVGSKGGVRSDINVTPLVDVVLVLLIIFMVITPMLQRDKTPATPEQLTTAMREAVAAGKRVMIKADSQTEYLHVRPVLDRASKAKMKNLQLAAEELKNK